LLWDFALFMEGKQKEFTARGGIAFICLKLVKGKLERMYFARNTYPLNMQRTKDGLMLSSEGEGEPIKSDTLYNWNYKLRRLTKRPLTIPGYVYSTTPNWNNRSNYDKQGNYLPSGAPAYTPGSFASGQSPSLLSCNCTDVGWMNCEYHGSYSSNNRFDDLGDPQCDDCIEWGIACNQHFWEGYDPVTPEERAEKETEKETEVEREGRKLGNILARQFGHLFKDDDDPVIPRSSIKAEDKNIIEYEHDPKTQMMLPVGTVNREKEENEMRRLEDRIIAITDPITEEQVMQEYMAYLAGVKGHFEQAYWAMEVDYEKIVNKPRTKENIRSVRLLEKVMQRIMNDPEYISEEAVSDVWSKLWQNQTK
jgi:hypothetical protein